MYPLARIIDGEWMTEQLGLFSGPLSSLFSATLPAWGMTRRGALYELPTPALPTDGRGYSSTPNLPTPTADHSRGIPSETTDFQSLPNVAAALLPTPVAQPSGNSPENHLRKKPGRKQVTDLAIIVENGNGHGASLTQEALSLLPTPTARDYKDTQIRREPHRPNDVDTLSRALTLLPTPKATDNENRQHPGYDQSLGMALGLIGASTPPLSDDGNDSPDPHQPPLFPA